MERLFLFTKEVNVTTFKCALSVVMNSLIHTLVMKWSCKTSEKCPLSQEKKNSFFCFLFPPFFPLNRAINKADYSRFYYYVKALLKHLTICLMAGNMFLMVTLDKILSICYSNSNQTAKHILQ